MKPQINVPEVLKTVVQDIKEAGYDKESEQSEMYHSRAISRLETLIQYIETTQPSQV